MAFSAFLQEGHPAFVPWWVSGPSSFPLWLSAGMSLNMLGACLQIVEFKQLLSICHGVGETLPKELKPRVGKQTKWVIFLKWGLSATQREAPRKDP